MDNREIVKQMIDFHKASFENCFSMMITIHDQAEKLLKTYVEKTPGMSDGSKQFITQWSDMYKKGIDNCRKSMNEGYDKLEKIFDKNAVTIFQDQAQQMFNSYLNQVNWVTPDLKKIVDEWTAIYRKGCDEFKKYVDENIWRMTTFPVDTQKSQTKKKK